MFRYLFTPRHTTSSLFPDGMDMHTHILWGVDDGASSLQESLGIIRRLKSFGLRGAYCTPHIKACYPENTPDFLRRRFEQLLASVTNEQFELNWPPNICWTIGLKSKSTDMPRSHMTALTCL